MHFSENYSSFSILTTFKTERGVVAGSSKATEKLLFAAKPSEHQVKGNLKRDPALPMGNAVM